jgi:hypothetical protein
MPVHTRTLCPSIDRQTPGPAPGLTVKTHLKAGGIILDQ